MPPTKPSFEPVTLPHTEAFDLTAESGETYRISVGLPLSYANTSKSYPVLYVLDADFVFATALEMTRLRGMTGEIAEVVVVGIGYPRTADFAIIAGARRTFDFSVTSEWDRTIPVARDAAAVFAAMGHELRLGGAPAFMDFIVAQLQPLVNAHYRVDSADQALFGDSSGGNFAGYALFHRPASFAKYIIGSPGFCYNDWEVFRLEEAYAKSHADLPVLVYLAVGSGETLQMANGGLVSGTARMAETLHLRRYPGLRLTCEILTGKTHYPAAIEILNRGLELCWPGATYEVNGARVKALMEDLRGP